MLKIICFILFFNLSHFVTGFSIFSDQLLAKIAKKKEDDFIEMLNKVNISKTIVNSHDFDLILNPGVEFCKNQKNLFLLIYVHSDPRHLKQRIVLRETWAKQSMFSNIKTIFVMGVLSNQSKIMQLVKLEQNVYNDIVQENFEDSYRNLTYKAIAALKWVTYYCSNAKFILKVDDDIMTNIFVLLKHLKSLSDHNAIKPNTIMCHIWWKSSVSRNNVDKWSLTKEEYERDWFGSYCSGSAFVLTNDLVVNMFNISFYIPFFWIDDYYISGLLPRAVGAKYDQISSLYTLYPGFLEQRFMHAPGPIQVFGHAPSKMNTIFKLWNYVLFKYIKSYTKINEGTIIFENDFQYIEHFEWSFNIWETYLVKI